MMITTIADLRSKTTCEEKERHSFTGFERIGPHIQRPGTDFCLLLHGFHCKPTYQLNRGTTDAGNWPRA